MKIPKYAFINDSDWKIRFKTKIIHKGTTDNLGLADEAKKTIYILKNQTFEETYETIAHEILHALDFEYDLNLKHEVIYKLEKPFADFLMGRNFFYE